MDWKNLAKIKKKTETKTNTELVGHGEGFLEEPEPPTGQFDLVPIIDTRSNI